MMAALSPLGLAGAETVVNTYTTGAQQNAAVSVGRDGRFVIVWQSPRDGSGYAVAAQRFAADGTRLGAEIQVNSYVTGDQQRPAVAVAADGRFVVAWESYGQDGDDFGVFAQRFAADGTRAGAEFRVGASTAGADYAPHLGALAGGGFVVTWTRDAVPSPDGSGSAVLLRRYDASGTGLGSELVVNTYTTGYQNFSYVGANAGGAFVVAWSGTEGDGNSYGAFAQRFDSSGARAGTEFRVNSYTTGA